MPTEYVEDKEMMDAVTEMLGDPKFTEFNPIREHEVKIDVRSCVRTDKHGENQKAKAEPITLKKVGQAERSIVDTDYILIVDNSAWAESNAGEGKIKVGTRKPDVVEFTETIVRFGAYRECILNLRDAMTLASKQVARKMQIENA
jgi:hypothetical protein